MRTKLITLLFLVGLAQVTTAAEGIISIESNHSVSETLDKLEHILEDKGFKIISRINHGAAAKMAGIELRETELLIFGNPTAGSPLMACQQSIAIDLPQKALARRDAEGKVWLSYNDPAYLQARHEVEGCDAIFTKIAGALNNFASTATR
jgi:uncharacterized protein (DUF302 family)